MHHTHITNTLVAWGSNPGAPEKAHEQGGEGLPEDSAATDQDPSLEQVSGSSRIWIVYYLEDGSKPLKATSTSTSAQETIIDSSRSSTESMKSTYTSTEVKKKFLSR